MSGLLLASSRSAAGRVAGAPGLRSAVLGDEGSSALASAIAVLIAIVALAGSQLERRRPEAIL